MKNGLPSWLVPDGTCNATGVVNDSSTTLLLEGNIIRSISNKIKINNSFHILFIRLKFITYFGFESPNLFSRLLAFSDVGLRKEVIPHPV